MSTSAAVRTLGNAALTLGGAAAGVMLILYNLLRFPPAARALDAREGREKTSSRRPSTCAAERMSACEAEHMCGRAHEWPSA